MAKDLVLGEQYKIVQGAVDRPIRPIQSRNEVAILDSVRQVQVKSGAGTTTTSSTPAGTPEQLLSVAATESPSKQQDRTFSQVSVSFTRDGSDEFFSGVRIWFTGYKGNTNPLLMTQGTSSPVSFLCETTGETVVVTVQPFSANGSVADFAKSITTTVALDGVVSAPPAPSISQNLVAIPLGLQFAFNQVNLGGTQDVIDSYRVYRYTSNSSGSASLIQVIKHDPTASGAIVVQDNVGQGGVPYFYWVTSVNTVGLESSKTAAQSGTVNSGTAVLDTDVSDGTAYLRRPSVTGNIVIDNANFEASTSILPPPGWTVTSGVVSSYETSTPQSGTQSLKLVTNGQGSGAVHAVKFKVIPGEVYKLSAYIKSDGTHQAGVTFKIYDSSGSAIANTVAIGSTTSTSWSFFSGTGTVAANAVYAAVTCEQFSVGASATLYFDNISCLKVLGMDDEVTDGSNRKAMTAASTSYRPTTNPLTGSDAGSNATITISSFTMRSNGTDISVNSGSITGLSYSTVYYIYYDDAGFAGGAVSFQSTTTKEVCLSSNARFYVGSIRTPAAGQPNTAGSSDGGSGAQAGLSVNIFPSANTGGTYSNMPNAYDGSWTSKCTGGANGLLKTVTFTGFSGSVPIGIQSLTLNVDSDVLGANDAITSIAYSTNSGTSFTNIYSVTSATRSRRVDSVSLGNSVSPQAIQVKCTIDDSGGVNATNKHEIYEIWLQATY